MAQFFGLVRLPEKGRNGLIHSHLHTLINPYPEQKTWRGNGNDQPSRITGKNSDYSGQRVSGLTPFHRSSSSTWCALRLGGVVSYCGPCSLLLSLDLYKTVIHVNSVAALNRHCREVVNTYGLLGASGNGPYLSQSV